MNRVAYTKPDYVNLVNDSATRGANLFHRDQQYQALLNRQRQIKNRLRELRLNTKASATQRAQIRKLDSQKHKIKRRLTQRQNDIIDEAITLVNDPRFQPAQLVRLVKSVTIQEKPTHKTKGTIASKLTEKLAEHHIRILYEQPNGSRHEIINSFSIAASKNYEYKVIRTDIQDFYESIDHTLLSNALEECKNVDNITRAICAGIIDSHKTLTKSGPKGLPRGVGLSSHLSNFYLKSFDQAIKSHPATKYYARYVDDIIAIYDLTINDSEYLRLIENNLGRLKLHLNPSKTTVVRSNSKGRWNSSLDYLGYSLSKGSDSNQSNFESFPIVGMSTRKLSRTKERIDLAKDDWLNHYTLNPKLQQSNNALLQRRLQFLTTNYKIYTGPRLATTGLYYSNQAMTPGNQSLQDLDDYLKEEVIEKLPPCERALGSSLAQISFVDAFPKKTIHSYRQATLKRYTHCWRNI